MISDRLKKTILNSLSLNDYDFKDDTLATEVPGWDSLNHVNVILAVEKEFNIRLKGIEVLRLKNVGELQNIIDEKLKLKPQ